MKHGGETMHRISISKAMLVIAFVAGNFAALRYLDPRAVVPGILTLLLAGLLPLVNAQIIALYVIVRRYRFVLERRAGQGYGVGAFAFSIFNAFVLTVLFVLCFVAPELLGVGLDYLFAPIGAWLLSIGYQPKDFDAPHFQFFVIPLIAATLLSGPALFVGLMIGWLTNSFEMVISLGHRPGFPTS
jgi:hypothetical protein